MTATNKRLLISESHGDSNWCTPCRGKPDQQATRFPHSICISSKTICISHGPHIATLRETPIDLDRSHCSWEKGLPTQSTAHRLTNPWVHTQFLFRTNQWSRGCKPSSRRWPTTRLTGPISPACDQYVQYYSFNTCSPTHRSLTDTGRGYNHGGAGLPHTSPWPSQPAISTFYLRAPPGLKFNQIPSTKSKCWV
jgi:hypothetical protein